MPKFGGVFSGDGNKESANESRDRRSALTAEEITNRLYPKPADIWRRDDPAAEPAKPEPEPVAVAAPAVAAEAPVAVEDVVNERSAPVATAEPTITTITQSTPAPAVAAPLFNPAAAPSAANGVDSAAERQVSVISRGSVFDGNYQTDGDVRVEGEVRGDITCKGHVFICDGAAVNAKISATSVSVAGRLSGEVTCNERFEAQPTARITSQISTPRLVIQEGAVVDGQIRMGTPE